MSMDGRYVAKSHGSKLLLRFLHSPRPCGSMAVRREVRGTPALDGRG